MNFQSKVVQEIEGNKWFAKKREISQSNQRLTKFQLKTILQGALTYYLIDAISFKMFIEIVDRVGERPEIRTMPEIEEAAEKLLSLSKYAFKPETHKENIIDTFNIVISKLLK